MTFPDNRQRLRGLYAITDSQLLPGESLFAAVTAAVEGGVTIIQYRDKISDSLEKHKNARRLLTLCKQYKSLLIINDDVDLAANIGADGVHLGLGDGSIRDARRRLGPKAIIGATCHGSLISAEKAKTEGASYLAFGRFFPSQTKPDAPPAELSVLGQARLRYQLPIVAIGGISLENAHIAINQGADMIAVVHSLFAAKDIKQTAINYQDLFDPLTRLQNITK